MRWSYCWTFAWKLEAGAAFYWAALEHTLSVVCLSLAVTLFFDLLTPQFPQRILLLPGLVRDIG